VTSATSGGSVQWRWSWHQGPGSGSGTARQCRYDVRDEDADRSAMAALGSIGWTAWITPVTRNWCHVPWWRQEPGSGCHRHLLRGSAPSSTTGAQVRPCLSLILIRRQYGSDAPTERPSWSPTYSWSNIAATFAASPVYRLIPLPDAAQL
jgi:hypothetical protein